MDLTKKKDDGRKTAKEKQRDNMKKGESGNKSKYWRRMEGWGPPKHKPFGRILSETLKLRLDILLIFGRDYFTSSPNTYFMYFSFVYYSYRQKLFDISLSPPYNFRIANLSRLIMWMRGEYPHSKRLFIFFSTSLAALHFSIHHRQPSSFVSLSPTFFASNS